MKNKIISLIMITLIFIVGCQKNKLYLDNNFYQSNEFINISENEINELKDTESTYILYTYNNFCNMKIPCENIFKEFMQKYNISFYSIPFSKFKNTYMYYEIKYAPSIIIVKNGKIIDYLDANDDDDYNKYQNVNEFTEWISSYIYLEIN